MLCLLLLPTASWTGSASAGPRGLSMLPKGRPLGARMCPESVPGLGNLVSGARASGNRPPP
jgi:hypothetical protein